MAYVSTVCSRSHGGGINAVCSFLLSFYWPTHPPVCHKLMLRSNHVEELVSLNSRGEYFLLLVGTDFNWVV